MCQLYDCRFCMRENLTKLAATSLFSLFRLMLLDPRYSHTEVLAVLDNVTVDDLPTALAHYMDDVIVSISRLECYVTGNVNQDGVSNINIRLL